MTCAELRASAAGLAALRPDDPERTRATEHASGCPECAGALAEGTEVIALLAREAAPPAPSAEVLRRVSAAVLAELDAESRVPVWTPAVLALSGLAGFAAILGISSHHLHGGAAMWAGAVALLAVAAGSLALSGAGRLVRALPFAAMALSFVPLALGASSNAFAARLGFRCLSAELAAAALALAVAGALSRTKRLGAPRGAGFFAAVTAAGALAGEAALHTTCLAHDAWPHLLAFHVGGVMLAAGLGAVAERLRRVSEA